MTRPPRRIVLDGVERVIPTAPCVGCDDDTADPKRLCTACRDKIAQPPTVWIASFTPIRRATAQDLRALIGDFDRELHVVLPNGEVVTAGRVGSLNFSSNQIDVTTFGDEIPHYIQGLPSFDMTVHGPLEG